MAYLGLETIRRGSTAACIQDIFQVHFPQARTVLDATYGMGRFWRWPAREVLGHDLIVTGVDCAPPPCVPIPAGGLYQYDYRHLDHLFRPGQFDVLCFDPPFIFTRGLLRLMGTRRAFTGTGGPRNPAELVAHYRRLFEQAALARQGLILKGQDLVLRTPDWWSFRIYELARAMGLGEPEDILIQQSPQPRLRDPRWTRQRYFRRSHCLYLIYKTHNRVVSHEDDAPHAAPQTGSAGPGSGGRRADRAGLLHAGAALVRLNGVPSGMAAWPTTGTRWA